jgi:hypothetical protein
MMLMVRRQQLRALGLSQRQQFVDEMCKHLRRHFTAPLRALDEPALRAHVTEALDAAAALGLASRRDGCRYLNLCATYGWRFLQAPANEWMRRCMGDSQVGSMSARLDLLVDGCLQRREVDAQDRLLAEKHGRQSPALVRELLLDKKPPVTAPDQIEAEDAPAPFASRDVDDDRILAQKR